MAVIVLVHGIAQEQYSADSLEKEWIPALAGGVRTAGFPDIADRLWRGQGGPGAIEARMAFYGHFFRRPGLQGDEPEAFSAEEELVAEELAAAWLENAANRASRPKERETAVRELAYVRHEVGQEEAGTGAMARKAINSLSRLRWFAHLGMGFAERFVNRALAQVTRYLTDETIRSAALKSVLDLVGSETKILIGHSLGSVVAYEASHLLQHPLDLLLTLGSPLGLQNIVYQRLRPQPPTFPAGVRRWVNIADREDFIAAEPDLQSLFSTGIPSGSVFESTYTVDNGAQPHDARFYLTTVEVGKVLGRVLCAGG
ncbi:MAG TPA: hypothetical protein VH682_21300 [Gemmataceae bacterium]|jgi:hypothetical protein